MIRASSLRLKPRVVVGLMIAAMSVASATAEPGADAKARVQTVSAEQFQTHVRSLQQLEQVCAADASSCDASKVGDDDRVEALHFQMRWIWLRQTLTTAHDAKHEGRQALLQSAANRLNEIATQNAQPADGARSAQFSKARADADHILNSAEFSNVEQQSWLNREMAKFFLWLGNKMQSMAVLGDFWPWVLRLLEWLFFGGAAVGLLLFVRRSLQRQRLAVALNKTAAELTWKRDSTDWAQQAEASARNGDWRDAVHCLYWATIVMLEGRRAWRHNPTRTPREYVRLLKPGSPQQGALRGLTQIFERLWYGLRDAGPADYERARVLYENLRDNATTGAA